MKNDQISFKDVVELYELQSLFENFSTATGFTVSLIDYTTNEALFGTGWSDICYKFHRTCPTSQENCRRSIKELISETNHAGEIRIHNCQNGLVIGGTPIIIQGNHLGNLITGQIFFAPPDKERFKRQAQKFDFDEYAYLQALDNVPVVSEEKFTSMLRYLAQTASLIAQTGLANLKTRDESNRKEALLQSIFRSAPVGIGLVSNRTFQWTNERMSEISGYSAEELTGQGAKMLYPTEEEFDRVGQEKYAEIKESGSGSLDTRWKRKDGTIIDVHLSSTPINQDDLAAGVTFTALDITDRKHAEEKLRSSERQLKEAQKIAKLGHWELNIESNTLFWSDEIYRILGLEPQEVKASYEMLLEAVHPEDKYFVKKAQTESVKNKIKYDIEYRVLLKSGNEKWVREIGSTEYNETGEPIRSFGIVHDITEIKILRGIIPICSLCHKLKNDEGYWKRVDQYLTENSKALFSHGMCENCADEFYGGQEWYEKNRAFILKK